MMIVAVLELRPKKYGDHAGFNLSSAGDFNGDGFDDIIYTTSGVGGGDGIVYFVFGSNSPNDLDLTNLVTFDPDGQLGTGDEFEGLNFNGLVIDGIHESGALAAKVVNVGDVDGDGFDDLLIGEYFIGTTIDPDFDYDPDNDPDMITERLEAGDTYLIYGGI